jgi:hypothetical protein
MNNKYNQIAKSHIYQNQNSISNQNQRHNINLNKTITLQKKNPNDKESNIKKEQIENKNEKNINEKNINEKNINEKDINEKNKNNKMIVSEAIRFKNNISTNNCFLNVVAQILYHTEGFNKNIFDYFLDKKKPNERDNPIYQLQYIFYHYTKFSKIKTETVDKILDTSKLRNSLNYFYNNFYGEDEVGDPIDVINNLFNIIHNLAIGSEKLNVDNSQICDPHCLVHKLFSIKLKELIQCTICKKNKIITYDNNYFIHNIFVSEILNEFHQKTMKTYQGKLFNFVKKLNNDIQNEIKLDDCKCKTSELEKKLYLYGKINPFLIINLTWNEFLPSIVNILKIYSSIPYYDNINNLFDTEHNVPPKHNFYLYGLIHFYNGHYTCSFRSDLNDENWYFVDDYQIKKFRNYKELIENLTFNYYHPTALFYKAETDKKIDEEKIKFTEEEYKKLYGICYDKDRLNNNPVSKLPSSTNLINSRLSSSKILISLEKQNSSTKNIKFDGDKWICPNCQKKNLGNSIKCWQCNKVFSNLHSSYNEFSVFNPMNQSPTPEPSAQIFRKNTKKSQKEESEFDQKSEKNDRRFISNSVITDTSSKNQENTYIKKKKTLMICKKCNAKIYEGNICTRCKLKI